uniref:Uncharacterized protein n=1 Tax=Myotis myotis TaxID=51298 RepID=A0A7J7TIG6_MYOMY|nr:hypothetical protein mMyoMyo1_009048 [Myotis myotis]
MNSISFSCCLPENAFNFLFLKDSFPGYRVFFVSTLNILMGSLLICKVHADKSIANIIGSVVDCESVFHLLLFKGCLALCGSVVKHGSINPVVSLLPNRGHAGGSQSMILFHRCFFLSYHPL